jgi:hypothetical protein
MRFQRAREVRGLAPTSVSMEDSGGGMGGRGDRVIG